MDSKSRVSHTIWVLRLYPLRQMVKVSILALRSLIQGSVIKEGYLYLAGQSDVIKRGKG